MTSLLENDKLVNILKIHLFYFKFYFCWFWSLYKQVELTKRLDKLQMKVEFLEAEKVMQMISIS